MLRDIVCFYIISHTIYNCITTVYRSYGANRRKVVVLVSIRVEHVVGTSRRYAGVTVQLAWTEVSIA